MEREFDLSGSGPQNNSFDSRLLFYVDLANCGARRLTQMNVLAIVNQL